MQKVFIRGVEGRGKEVIAKLEALGGINKYKYNGESGCLYIEPYSNFISTAVAHEFVAVVWTGTEIFLDEPVKEVTPVEESKPAEEIFDLYKKVKTKKDGYVSTIKQRLRDIDDNTMVYVLDNMPNMMFYQYELEEANINDVESNKPRTKQHNFLLENDIVMCSMDGHQWDKQCYYKDNLTHAFTTTERGYYYDWKYIVPYYDFDFQDLESNIERSVV